MPAKKRAPAAKPKPWQPPAGLKIDVQVARGDVAFRAEAAVGDAMHVARLLVAMARQIALDAPDVLPHADVVGGGTLPYWDDEWADDGRAGRVGFHSKR